MGRGGTGRVPADPTLSQRVPNYRVGYPLIYGTGKDQKMTDLQEAGRISQMVNGAGTRPTFTPSGNNKKEVSRIDRPASSQSGELPLRLFSSFILFRHFLYSIVEHSCKFGQ